MTFVPLLVYSEYSLPHSVVRIDELCKKAKACGISALALTDQGHFLRHLSFLKAVRLQVSNLSWALPSKLSENVEPPLKFSSIAKMHKAIVIYLL